MTVSRYTKTPRLEFGARFGTNTAIPLIRKAIKDGRLPTKQTIVRGSERLDTLAGVLYGDARYWWILAAASDIGWGMQVPVGTIINVPDLATVTKLVGG